VDICRPLGRPLRQRTTGYGPVPAERQAAAERAEAGGLLRASLPLITRR